MEEEEIARKLIQDFMGIICYRIISVKEKEEMIQLGKSCAILHVDKQIQLLNNLVSVELIKSGKYTKEFNKLTEIKKQIEIQTNYK